MQPSEGVTWLLQMSREMSIEAQTWELFAVTWKAIGFAFGENGLKRVRAHARTVEQFLADVREELVPKGSKITAADLRHWTQRFERLQKAHGQLIAVFRSESDRFAVEFADAGAAWAPVSEPR